jgi:hypothetical protein
VDDTEHLEAIAIDEATGQIAVSGGADIFVYQPNGFKGESLKVRICRVLSVKDHVHGFW